MKNRLLSIKDHLSQSFWFIPSVMVVFGILLSFAAIELDRQVGVDFARSLGIYINSPEGSREVLSTIASSTITVISLVFSLTIVVLSLAAQQYGPLIIGNFMSDHGNQAVLGMFTMSFLYCLLVLRTIRDTEDTLFVPHISTLIGVGMAVLDVAVLIYFIHHVSDSVKPSAITSRITHRMIGAIDNIFPQQLGKSVDTDTAPLPGDFNRNLHPIHATTSGYLQMLDVEELINIAKGAGVIIKLDIHPGDFIVKNSTIGMTYPGIQTNGDLTDAINDTFIIGRSRTPTQDIRFLFEQLVEIGVRGVSPGINDPFTSSMCIDRLAEGLCRFVTRKLPSPYRYDDQKQLRIIAKTITFEDMLNLSFNQIRHYGGADVRIVLRIITALQRIAECVNEDEKEKREVLRRYINMVWQESRHRLTAEWDQREAEVCYQAAIQVLHD
jgi:uncharacterized membrane protein